MTKINYTLSAKNNADKKKEIHLRFIGGKSDVFRGKTGIYINEANWDNGKAKANSRTAAIATECRHINAKLSNLSAALVEAYNGSKTHDRDWLKNIMNGMRWEDDDPVLVASTSFSAMLIHDSFLSMIDERLRNGVIKKSTYESYRKTWIYLEGYNERLGYRVCDFSSETAKDIIDYISGLRKRGIKISDNTLLYNKKIISLWWNWCQLNDTTLKPVVFPKMKPLSYGTPFYLDKKMRDALAVAPMPSRYLEQARDIFILQCFIGCRFSDLLSMTYDNIRDGKVYYIAQKTITHEPETISVPLHPTAVAIIKKYRGCSGNYIIPRVRVTTINNQLKLVFEACDEANKLVTIRDRHTGQSVTTTLAKVASTHMARRTFIGCLYENGFRESDICSLSGHKEGSISIQRYRRVSDSIKQSMIDSL